MARDIAVFVGENGKTASLYDQGKIVIYQKRRGEWRNLKEKPFSLADNQSLKELRSKMAEALIFLEGCDIFVGLSVVGVPFFELEKAGFNLWEFAGPPMEFLDYVLEKEEEAQLQSAKVEISSPPSPTDKGNGFYSINLKQIQQNDSGFTSRQVLQPFIKQGKFYELEIICSHIPPWLEVQLQEGTLKAQMEKLGPNEIKLSLAKKTCHECE